LHVNFVFVFLASAKVGFTLPPNNYAFFIFSLVSIDNQPTGTGNPVYEKALLCSVLNNFIQNKAHFSHKNFTFV